LQVALHHVFLCGCLAGCVCGCVCACVCVGLRAGQNRIFAPYMTRIIGDLPAKNTVYTPHRIHGFSVLFFGSKGSINFVKVLESSNCLKGSTCNFGKRTLGLLPPPSNLPK